MTTLTRPHRRLVVALLTSMVSISATSLVDDGHVSASEPNCGRTSAVALDALFEGQLGRVVGADYLRGYLLPNGNRLLLMQDVYLAPSSSTGDVSSLWDADFAHNAGVLLDRSGCVVRTLTDRHSYIGGEETQPLGRWFWAMGGAMGADGQLHVLVAEMYNPNGTGAAIGAAPVSTWRATIDPISLAVTSFAPASDASAQLFGWAVTSDSKHTYLYSHCYRQFIAGEFLGHDLSCARDVHVARVPRGELDAPLQYFDGTGWSPDADAAAALTFPGERTINPVSVQRVGGRFVSVSKEGDWWGTTIFVDTATSPTGPWTTVATVTPAPKCADCSTYFASLLPWRQPDGALIVALSNNAWDMRAEAYPNPALYRSSVLEIAAPAWPQQGPSPLGQIR